MMFALFLCAVNGGGFEVSIPLDEVPDAIKMGSYLDETESPEHIIDRIVPGAEILGNLNVTNLGSLENATRMERSVDWMLAGPDAGNYTDYNRSVHAIADGSATIKGIAETGFPSPEHVPFMVVRNTTIGTGTPEMVVVLPRQCPYCNIGNTQTQDGVYIRAKAYICQKGVCRALDGSDTLNLTLVRFWLM
jgi:hypothetical protein